MNSMDSVKAPAASRIQSLDVLRGLIILVMMFVNDVAGVRGTPPWMKHVHPSEADGMTFVDVVFPAFLFIVGTSIPFAIGRRLEQGEPLRKIGQHILGRTLALLVIGVFMVNSETISKNGPLPPSAWSLLVYGGVLLLWIALPEGWASRRPVRMGMRAAGVAMLAAAALLYRGNDATGFFQMRTQWWGILGLIGWAYLAACAVYIPLRRQLAGVIGAVPLLYCLYIADAAGGLSWLAWLKNWVSVGEVLGSQAAITVSGVALGMILAPGSGIRTHRDRMGWAFVFGLGLLTAGHLLHSAHDLHRMFIFSKNLATTPWCLVSSAITAWLWIAVYWMVDVRQSKSLTSALAPPGQNALLAYILAPVLYSVIQLLASAGLPNQYRYLGSSFAVGFWRSLFFAVGVTWLAGRLRRQGIQLRL